MSNIVKQNFTFLRGLSSFWQKLFEDKDVVDALLNGGEQLMGQLYLDMLDLVLTPILDRCPIYHREYWHLLTISNEDLRFEDGKYIYTIPNELYDFRYLTNKVLNPSLIMELGFNFTLRDRETFREIVFDENIFDRNEFPGMVIRSGEEVGQEVAALWVVDGRFDKLYLYENFGFLVKRFSRSTQVYKDFVQGIWNYFTTGPHLRNVEAALNLIAGFPLAGETGEVVTSITIDVGTNEYVVETDRSEYRWTVPAGIKIEVGDVLDAFQPMTNAFQVNDVISDPDWFDGTVIPEFLMPGASLEDRVSFKSRTSAGIIGELGLFVDGSWFVGTPSGIPTTGYKILRNFLATHIFQISYNGVAIPFQVSINEMRTIVLAGKPAHTFAFVEAVTVIADEITETEDILAVQAIGSVRNDLQESTDADVIVLIDNEEMPLQDDYGNVFGSVQLAYPLNSNTLVVGGSHPVTGSIWRVGDNAMYDPAHSIYSGFWLPFVGGFVAGSIAHGLPFDYVVEIESFGSESQFHPFESEGFILADTVENPVLLSPGGSAYRVLASIGGALITEYEPTPSVTHSPVLISFSGDPHELAVSDSGVLEAQSSVSSTDDPIYWALVEDDFTVQYRVGVTELGALTISPD